MKTFALLALSFTFAIFLAVSANGTEFQDLRELEGDVAAKAQALNQFTFGMIIQPNMHCTGVLVGPNGESLTALHCLEKCLVNAKVTRKEKAYSSPVFPDPISKLKVKLPKDRTIKCATNFVTDGKKVEGELEVLEVFGPGFLTPRHLLPGLIQVDKTAFIELVKAGFEAAGDLALIRVPRLDGRTCAKIGFLDFHEPVNKPVANIAYTSVLRMTGDEQPKNDRQRKEKSGEFKRIGDYDHPLYSDGEAFSARALVPHWSDQDYAATLPPGIVAMTTDSWGGASGSPVFDNSGRVVGITRSTDYDLNSIQFKKWMTKAVDLAFHKEKFETLASQYSLCK